MFLHHQATEDAMQQQVDARFNAIAAGYVQTAMDAVLALSNTRYPNVSTARCRINDARKYIVARMPSNASFYMSQIDRLERVVDNHDKRR